MGGNKIKTLIWPWRGTFLCDSSFEGHLCFDDSTSLKHNNYYYNMNTEKNPYKWKSHPDPSQWGTKATSNLNLDLSSWTSQANAHFINVSWPGAAVKVRWGQNGLINVLIHPSLDKIVAAAREVLAGDGAGNTKLILLPISANQKTVFRSFNQWSLPKSCHNPP